MVLKIKDINIGQRVRDEYGDMESLANSIKEHGLLHPIVVDAHYNLIAGGRRLLACERIGMKEIEAKMLGEISERELRVLELEENIRRKDLTALEKSKNLVELAEIKEQELREKAEKEVLSESDINSSDQEISAESTKNLDMPQNENWAESAHLNDPNKIGARKVAAEIGVSRETLRDAKQHVAAVEEFPELEEFPKYEAIETAKELRQAPEEEREKILDFAQRKTQTVSARKEAYYDAYIEECWKLVKKYHKAMSAFMWIKADEKEFKMLSEIIGSNTAGTHLSNVEDAIPKLARIRTFMKGVIEHGENKNFRI